jgi:hypothetical protein
MGLSEIAARVRQTGANAALIISMWKGNPSILSFTTSAAEEFASIKIEMAMLRREVSTSKLRTNKVSGVFVESQSSEKTCFLGELLADLLNIELREVPLIDPTILDPGQTLIWLQDEPSGKILWTHYHTTDAIEMGPRIRVVSIRRSDHDE